MSNRRQWLTSLRRQVLINPSRNHESNTRAQQQSQKRKTPATGRIGTVDKVKCWISYQEQTATAAADANGHLVRRRLFEREEKSKATRRLFEREDRSEATPDGGISKISPSDDVAAETTETLPEFSTQPLKELTLPCRPIQTRCLPKPIPSAPPSGQVKELTPPRVASETPSLSKPIPAPPIKQLKKLIPPRLPIETPPSPKRIPAPQRLNVSSAAHSNANGTASTSGTSVEHSTDDIVTSFDLSEEVENLQTVTEGLIVTGDIDTISIPLNGTLDIEYYDLPTANIDPMEVVIDQEEDIVEHQANDNDFHPSEDDEERPSVRKRLNNPKNWKKNIAKEALNKGLEHLNCKGKLIRARKMGMGCKHTCRFKCHQKISPEVRELLFKQFWALGNKTRQFDIVKGHIIVKEPVVHKRGAEKTKQQSVNYFFIVNCQQQKVCQTMFLTTLDISETTVRTARKKLGEGHTCSPDKRGFNAKVLPEVRARNEANVMTHIKSFKPVESHYCRERSKRKYLPGKLNVSAMYEKFSKEWMPRHRPLDKVVSKKWCRNIFNTKFNIGFHRPKNDQCDQCAVYEAASERIKEKLKKSFELHRHNKGLAQELKEQDKIYAAEHPEENICYAVVDMEKVLECPKTKADSLYYKRKFSINNFTIWEGTAKEGYCYTWNESEAGKGANEITSCMLDFIDMMVAKGKKIFVFWSDNCGNQNQNKYLFSMYTHVCAKYGIKVGHKFLEKGHTWQEADNMHASIERNSATVSIFEPEDWIDVLKRSAKNKTSHIIKKMGGKIKDFHPFAEKNQNWKQPNAKWSKVREVLILPDQPDTLRLKHDHNDMEYVDVCVRAKTVGRPLNLAQVTFKDAYVGQLPLKPAKLKDLAALCNALIIPAEKHNFYKNLTNFPDLNNVLLEEESDHESDIEHQVNMEEFSADEDDEIDFEEELRRLRAKTHQNQVEDDEDED